MQTKQHNISLAYGIHRTPSLGHDGELSECINVIPRHGELVNILPPTKVGSMAYTLIAVHHVSDPDRDNYISRDARGENIYYRAGIDGTDTEAGLTIPVGATVTPIGNVLCVSTSGSINYYLWENGGYTDLGDADFDIDIQFGLRSHIKVIPGSSNVKVARTDLSGDLQDFESIAEIGAVDSDVTLSNKEAKFSNLTLVAGQTYQVKVKPKKATKGMFIAVTAFEGNGIGRNRWMYSFDGEPGSQGMIFTLPDNFGYTEGETEVPITTITGGFIVAMVDHIEGNGRTVYRDIVYVNLLKYASGQQPTSSRGYQIAESPEIVMGVVNQLTAGAAKGNQFIMPFFARYALKLKTGHLIKLSAPCYLEPNTLYAPRVMFLGDVYRQAAEGELQPEARAYLADLYYRVNDDGALNRLRKLDEVVDSIVVAITPPIYLYDQGATDEYLMQMPIRSVGTGTGTDRWGQSDNRSLTIDGAITDQINPNTYRWQMLLPVGEESTTVTSEQIIHERAKSALSTWFIVKEISIRSLAEGSDWAKLSLDTGTLAALYAQDTERFATLNDTAVSAYKLLGAEGTFAYNDRLFYLGGTQQRHKGWNPVRMSGWVGTWAPNNPNDTVISEVSFASLGDSFKQTFPRNGRTISTLRFYCYPDALASILEVSQTGGKNLTPQGTQELAVAFFWSQSTSAGGSGTLGLNSFYPNKLYMSYANQPLALDRNASLTLTGAIRAMSVVTQALSQGQFGQFPIYVFTSDGIWTLEVSNTNAIVSSHPISRDVITKGTKPLQTDDAIFFITAQGLKRIVGSTVTLVSTPVHNFNFPAQSLTIDTQGYGMFKALLEAADVRQTFETAIQQAQLLYDYAQQLVHVFIPVTGAVPPAHYVYSLESGEWAQQCLLEYNDDLGEYISAFSPSVILPGYPHTIIQANDNDLYRFDGGTKGDNASQGLNDIDRAAVALTRPIDFGDPVGMKALMDFRLIGLRTTPRVLDPSDDGDLRKVAIYASKDGYTWRPLRSLKAGSYKYFRFLILSRMSDFGTLTGLTCHYQTRRSHRLR